MTPPDIQPAARLGLEIARGVLIDRPDERRRIDDLLARVIPTSELAPGPIEIIIGQGRVQINSCEGPILTLFAAKHVIIHYLDQEQTEVYGDLKEPTSN